MCAEIKIKVQSLKTEQNKYIFKQNLNDDSDGDHLTSFETEFQTEEAKENKGSPSVASLCAGQLRKCMVYELDQVLQDCDSFSVA